VQARFLGFAARRLSHPQSPNIRMFGRAIPRQRGQSGNSERQQALLLVKLGLEVVGGPDAVMAAVEALQVMDRAVALGDALFGKTGFLELAVDVAGEHEGALRQALADSAQDRKPSCGTVRR
jgi:hypothetical protein